MGNTAQLGKADRGIYEIAQNDLAGLHVTGEKVFDALAEKRLTETGIAFYTRADCFFEISCQRHKSDLSNGNIYGTLGKGRAALRGGG